MSSENKFPRHVAILGAAGGLGMGLVDVCREANVRFTAIVRSRPERIANIPLGSRVVVIDSLADAEKLVKAFSGVDAVISAVGVTATSNDSSAFLSKNLKGLASAMKTAKVDRLILINSLACSPPGEPASLPVRFFSLFPGNVGQGAREMQAVVDAIAEGQLADIRWTLIRAGVNSKGKHVPPIASDHYNKKTQTLMPVSYKSMAKWMLEEVEKNLFVNAAPAVTRGRGQLNSSVKMIF